MDNILNNTAKVVMSTFQSSAYLANRVANSEYLQNYDNPKFVELRDTLLAISSIENLKDISECIDVFKVIYASNDRTLSKKETPEWVTHETRAILIMLSLIAVELDRTIGLKDTVLSALRLIYGLVKDSNLIDLLRIVNNSIEKDFSKSSILLESFLIAMMFVSFYLTNRNLDTHISSN